MAVSVRMPRLLDAQMQEVARLSPLKLTLEENLTPLSHAEMLLPGEEALQCGDFVELYDPEGSAGIFRVTATERNYGPGGRSRVWLAHGLSTLTDRVIAGPHGCFGLAGEVASGAFMNAAHTLREGPGSGASLGSLPAGTPVLVLGQSGGWLQVTAGSQTGYVPAAYVTRNAEAGPFPFSATVKSTGTVYLRVGTANNSYTIIGLAPGASVTVVGARGSWYMVTTGEVTGWLQKAYVQPGSAVAVQGLTVQTVLSDLLTTFQPGGWWQAGTGTASAGLGYVFEQENLLEAVLRIPSGLTGSWRWQTDQTALPWKLSLQPMSDEIACEMRLRRNLTGLRVSVNRDELCTVMVPLGKDGLTIAEVNGGSDSLIAESAATWGRVERIYRDAREDDPAALKAAAQRALSHLCAPLVTVEAEGLALKHLTGELLDGLHLGDVCRVALPETGETLLERIVSLRWEDVLHAPEQVRVTMANRLQSASSLLAEVNSRVSIR